ncbi:MAG: 2-hydroxyacyl-CoA dehydratase family protein [Gracilibacteraceae bacterium]|jgi:hypothetical protein|nr:2-hydroxyacyl-CoA dehydratase family protein [Gracilibacteraceae bacterium]
MSNLIGTISRQVDSVIEHAKEKYADQMWMFDVQKASWDAVYHAHDEGKRLIYVGACAPVELIYAFDCVPFVLDMIPTRLASTPEVAARYIDLAEKYIAPTMCGIDKVDIGAILSGDMPDKPDAFIYSTVPCDNSRVAYPFICDRLGCPSYCIDVPFRKNEMGFDYMARQYKEIIVFLEKLTGKKLDWDKFQEIMTISNQTNDLMNKIADLRRITPCPLPGRLLVLNEMIPGMVGHPAMLSYLEAQYAIGQDAVAKGLGAVKEEKYRVSWLQNMLWSNVGILDWMERKFGAVLVMDAFGYQRGHVFRDIDDLDTICVDFAKKGLALPMIHGASGPVEDYIDLVENTMGDYNVSVSMFIGHVGCKHTWAAAKIITDMIQEKFGLPTLYLDVDAVDGRYKKTDEIRALITEYMETIEENK